MTDTEQFWMIVYIVITVICFFIDIELGMYVICFFITSNILYVVCTAITTEEVSDKWIPCPNIFNFRI